FAQGLASLPAAIRDDVRMALTTPPPKRTEVQKYLADKFQPELKPNGDALIKKLAADPNYKTKHESLTQAIEEQNSGKRTISEIRAFYDVPGEATTYLLKRGDYYLPPGPEVKPGVLQVLENAPAFHLPARAPEAKTSGRRLAFARWLTRPDH